MKPDVRSGYKTLYSSKAVLKYPSSINKQEYFVENKNKIGSVYMRSGTEQKTGLDNTIDRKNAVISLQELCCGIALETDGIPA